MRAFQFWILVLGATLVSLLMIKNVFIVRAFNKEERVLTQSEQMAAAGPEYETAWKTLAMHIYEKGRSDAALAAVLKNADVEVRAKETPSPDSGTAPASAPATAPSAPAKTPATP